jgi:Flp pilus assembly protein TadD
LTGRLIQNNRYLASPFVLEGISYMAEKKYAQAERRFLAVLQVFPTQQAAVEGLAHVHYLMGDSGSALEVLNDTAKFSFPPQARKRFDALKAFYGQ